MPVTVGVVGLGPIGASVARAVTRGGFSTFGYDIRSEAVAALESPIRPAASLEELGEACDTVLVAVWDDQQVFDVMEMLLGVASPPRTVAILSTVSVATIASLRESAAAAGIDVLDCAVTGGERLRQHGRIVVMVGGDDQAVAAARPVLETFGDPVIHMGALGAGMRAKLARNMIIYGQSFVALEAAKFAAAGGVEVEKLAQVCEASDRWKGGTAQTIRRGTLYSSTDDPVAARAHFISTCHKDLRAAIEAAEEVGVEVHAAKVVDERFERLMGLEQQI